MNKKKVARKILYFPLTKIIIGLLVCAGIPVALNSLALKVFKPETPFNVYTGLIVTIIAIAFIVALYILLYRIYEKRKITEFSAKSMIPGLGKGMLLGAFLQILIVLVIYLAGGFSVVSVNSALFIIPSFTMAFSSGFFEEVVSRGIIFRITEEKLGSYIALIISSLIFGALHLFNPNVSVLGMLLVLLAGLFLAAAYMYTRNLWFPIGIHFAWNFTMEGIFGANVSGYPVKETFITTRMEGPEWLTGGLFGPEASIQANVLVLAATIVLLIWCHKKGTIIKPYWKKKDKPEAFSIEPPASMPVALN